MTKTILLGEVAEIIKGISYRSADYSNSENGIAFVNLKSVARGGGYNADGIKYYAGQIKPSQYVEPGDILIANTDLTQNREIIGSPIIMPNIGRSACFSLDLSKIVVTDTGIVNHRYLFYYLKSPIAREYMLAHSNGSTVMHLSVKAVPNMKLNLPPLDKQKKIANILSSLDEKIELNRRMNETLEQLGQALFRHYFVDNPEANSWDDVKVGELVDIKGGGTPSTKNSSFWGGDIVWSSPRDLANQKCHFLMRTDKTITKQGLSKISSGMLPAGTLLLSSRAPIGYIAFAGVDMAINQGYIAFLPKAKLSNYFMYFWLKNNIQKIKDSANGSTFLEISKTAFRNIYIKQPNQLLHNKFQYESMIILDKIRDNEAEIYNLTSLRDSLLPKLISGEVIL